MVKVLAMNLINRLDMFKMLCLLALAMLCRPVMAQSDTLAVAEIADYAVAKQEADSLYDKGQYADAVDAYEGIIANCGISADLYYNLGNAYYKLDDIAHAILYYERALLLNQGDADIRTNLALARGKTIDRKSVVEGKSV